MNTRPYQPTLQWLGLALACLAALALPAHAQTLRSNFGQIGNGTIYAVASNSTHTYVGGSFTSVPLSTGYGTTVSTANPALVATDLPFANSDINAAIPDGAGGWYIGGQFTTVGGQTRSSVAHLLANKTLDPNFVPSTFNEEVRAMALSGGFLYVGGDFTTIGGQTRNHIARINAATGKVDETWYPAGGADNSVYALQIIGGDLFVGGTFDNFGTATGTEIAIARVNIATTTVTDFSPFTDTDYAVYALATNGTNLFVGGSFSLNSGAIDDLAQFTTPNATPTLTTSWAPKSAGDGVVYALLASGGKLYVGGSFEEVKTNNDRAHLARFNIADAALETWNPGTDNDVRTMALSGTSLFVGGSFDNAGGAARSHLAKLSTTGNTADANWVANTDNDVFAVALQGANLYVGGQFSNFAINIARLARFHNSTGKPDLNWGLSVNNGTVYALALNGDYLYIAGTFSGSNSVGSSTRNRLAKINITGTGSVDSWNVSVNNGAVNALALDAPNDHLYLGGSFNGSNSVGNQTRNRLAKLNTSNGDIDSWNMSVNNNAVNALALDAANNHLYLGGTFTSVGGQTRNRLAKINISGNGSLDTWSVSVNNGAVNALAHNAANNLLYLGGSFNGSNSVGNQTRNRLARLATTGAGSIDTWNIGAGSTVNALALNGSALYLGGDFTTLSVGGSNTTRNRLASVSTSASTVNTWNPNAGNGGTEVFALLLANNNLYAGGNFTTMGGSTRNRLAVFGLSNATIWNGTAWTSGDPNASTWAVISSVSPNPPNLPFTCGDLTIENGVALNIASGQTITVNGKLDIDGSLSIASGGSLVQTSTSQVGSFTGSFTVQRNNGYTGGNSIYNHWASPVKNAPVSLLSGTSYRRRYTYHEPSAQWLNSDAGITANISLAGDAKFYATAANFMIPGVGYTSLRSNSIAAVTFTGEPNNGNIAVNTSSSTTNASYQGYNLVGNPYPSAILINDGTGGATGLLEDTDNAAFEPSAYVFANGNNNTGSGAYIVVNEASINKHVASGQGFFVVRTLSNTSGNLTFKNAHRAAANNTTFYRGEAASVEHLSLKLRRTDGQADNLVLALANNFTDAYENGRDARKMDANNELNLAARWNGQRLAQVAIAKTDRLEIPLALNTTRTGEHTFAADELPTATTLPLFLEDRATGEFYYLQAGREHKINLAAGKHEGRFFVRTINEAANTVQAAQGTQAFSYGHQLYVRFAQAAQGTAQVTVFNSMGLELRNFNNVALNGQLQAFDLAGLGEGIYIVRASTSAGTHEQRVWIGTRK